MEAWSSTYSPFVGDPGFTLGIGLVIVAGFSLAPLLIRAVTATRRPGWINQTTARALDGEIEPEAIYVVSGTRGEQIDAFAVGIFPGFQYVFVTEALVESFDPEEIAAIIAHETAHLRLGHLRQRCLVVAVAGIFWALFVPVAGFAITTVVVGAVVLTAILGLGLRHEYAADRYAVSKTGRAVTLEALTRLCASTAPSRVPAPLDRLSARAWVRRRIVRLEREKASHNL